jgi:cytochrome c peroxidase
MKPTLAFLTCLLAVAGVAACTSASNDQTGSSADDLRRRSVTKESLGKKLFADESLSEPGGQSCASCHDPNSGFADPRGTMTSEGAIAGRFGIRNAPAITYASFIPPLLPGGDESGYAGGMFWDGRVSTLEEQAVGPVFNPLEMNNTDHPSFLVKLKALSYAADFETLYGANALDDADTALGYFADAIASYERALPNRFSSKFDAVQANQAQFNAQEQRGFTLFEDKRTGPCTPQADGSMAPPCGCAQCHLDQKQADGSPPMFTDFGYDNIGIPFNSANPFYQLPSNLNPGGPNFVDNGLGVVVHNPRQFAHFKAPSIRNVALTAPYGHNGYFKTLKDIVHFYNTRDVHTEHWPAPESTFNLNATGLGNLGLSSQDEDDLVAFLDTLTDGYFTP